MELYVLLKNGIRIEEFDLNDEYCVRQQCFMQFKDWGTLIFRSPVYLTELIGKKNEILISTKSI